MSKTFTVNLNGMPIKTFSTEADARDYLLYLVHWKDLTLKQFAYVDEAVLKSDMKESKAVLKHIMEMK